MAYRAEREDAACGLQILTDLLVTATHVTVDIEHHSALRDRQLQSHLTRIRAFRFASGMGSRHPSLSLF